MIRLSSFVEKIRNCKIALVVDDYLIDDLEGFSLSNIDFLRVNFYSRKIIPQFTLSRGNGQCYKLARIIVSNLIDFDMLVNIFYQSGFNGMQVIKGHESDIKAKLDKKIQDNLIELKEKDDRIDIFLESNIENMNQPIFNIENIDHGICLSSLLCLTVKSGKIMRCPYNHSLDSVVLDRVDNMLEHRMAVDSLLYNCYDCGYISDNNLYKAIYKELGQHNLVP